MTCNESAFLKKFVTKYQEEVPELLMAYQGKMGLLRSDIETEEVRETVMS